MQEHPHQENIKKRQWEAAQARVQSLLKEILHSYALEEEPDALDALINHYHQLLAQAGLTPDDAKRCAAYHTFSGSSTTFESHPEADLPGDLSMVAFLERQLEQRRATSPSK